MVSKYQYDPKELDAFMKVLKESGKCNMLAAAPYIQDYFQVPRQVAKSMNWKWVKRQQELIKQKQELKRLLTPKR